MLGFHIWQGCKCEVYLSAYSSQVVRVFITHVSRGLLPGGILDHLTGIRI